MVKGANSPAVVLRLQFPINVLPSLPATICTWKIPLTVMGVESWRVITLVSPLALQVPVADSIVTAEGPVITKSLPFGAMELHNILSVKFKVREEGEQFGGGIVPIGIGGCGANINCVPVPAVT
jgi:hypothetical protein